MALAKYSSAFFGEKLSLNYRHILLLIKTGWGPKEIEIVSVCLKGLRTQMTGIKSQQLGASLLAISGQKAHDEGIEDKIIKRKQRQEVIFRTDFPHNHYSKNHQSGWDIEVLQLRETGAHGVLGTHDRGGLYIYTWQNFWQDPCQTWTSNHLFLTGFNSTWLQSQGVGKS